MGSEILKAGGNSISIVGSQFFILVTGTSTATIRIGWKGVTNPSKYAGLISTLFEGIVEELVRASNWLIVLLEFSKVSQCSFFGTFHTKWKRLMLRGDTTGICDILCPTNVFGVLHRSTASNLCCKETIAEALEQILHTVTYLESAIIQTILMAQQEHI